MELRKDGRLDIIKFMSQFKQTVNIINKNRAVTIENPNYNDNYGNDNEGMNDISDNELADTNKKLIDQSSKCADDYDENRIIKHMKLKNEESKENTDNKHEIQHNNTNSLDSNNQSLKSNNTSKIKFGKKD